MDRARLHGLRDAFKHFPLPLRTVAVAVAHRATHFPCGEAQECAEYFYEHCRKHSKNLQRFDPSGVPCLALWNIRAHSLWRRRRTRVELHLFRYQPDKHYQIDSVLHFCADKYRWKPMPSLLQQCMVLHDATLYFTDDSKLP